MSVQTVQGAGTPVFSLRGVSMYGKNTTGGAINFITSKPVMEKNEGYLTVGAAAHP